MALTLPRWVAAAVAGILIILASYLSRGAPKERQETPREALVRTQWRAGFNVRQVATQLRASQLRDSVSAAIARVAATDTSRMIVSPSVSAEMRAYDRVLATRLALIRSPTRTRAIDVAFIWDTASAIRNSPINRTFLGVTHVLPLDNKGRCLAIVRHMPRANWYSEANRRWWSAYLTSAPTAARVLGPCGFYEAYGAPGPQIDRWLSNGAWRYGAFASLRGGPGRYWMQEYDWWEPLWGTTAGWPLRRYITPAGYLCASGDASACKRLLLDPTADRAAGRGTIVTEDRIVEQTGATDRDWYATLGPEEPMLLADMARSLGADQFRRFWTSDKPADEAFLAATGQDIGAWTAAWARSNYGENGRGPATNPKSASFAVLLALAFLGGAIAASRRRQVG